MNRIQFKNHGITGETLRDDIEALRGDVAELAVDVSRYASEKARAARGTASEVMERSRSAIELEWDRALDGVRQHPLASVSFGFAVGFALGSIACGRQN